MKKYERAFLVQLIPDAMLKKWNVSQAANNFFRNVISCGAFDQVVTLVPVCVVDDLRQECLKMPEIDHAVQCRCFPNKSIGKALNNLVETFQLFALLCRAKSIWFYNITSSNVLLFLLLWLFRKKVYVLLADFTPPCRRVDFQRVAGWCIRHASGVLALSGRTDFKCRNLKVLPGIVPKKSVYLPNPDTLAPHFLFSGKLGAVTGIDMALDVFSAQPNLPLVITGYCSQDDAIRQRIVRYPNVRYLGSLSLEEYIKVLKNAAWALSLRDPSLPENSYNFPSKILEYLACGKIVLSTIRYPELEGFRYFYADFNQQAIANTLHTIAGLNGEEMQEIRKHNLKHLENFSEKRWFKIFSQIEKDA